VGLTRSNDETSDQADTGERGEDGPGYSQGHTSVSQRFGRRGGVVARGARAAARACAADAAIARDCCGTRDLPDSSGGIIAARVVHDVALAELADRFAFVAASAEILPRRAIFPSREL